MPQTIQLLLLCWLLMFGIAHEWSQRATMPWSWRISFLFASVAWGTTLVAITEVLSLFQLFQREALLTAWVSVFVTGGMFYGGLLYHRVRMPFSLAKVRLVTTPPIALHRWKISEWKVVFPSRLMVIMLLLIGLQVMTLAMAAYQYAPNSWDSMTYHLARIVHWQQAQSVHHYATHIDRQIQMPPFASFVMAHLHTLTVGDQFVNLVQWFAMIVCLVGVAEIAWHLGADQTGQVIAVLLCVSIPMGILQATSTQIDYVVAAWLVCFVAFGINVLRNVRQWSYIIGTGLALGLALLTKSSAFIYAPPFAVVIGLVLLYRLRGTALIRGIVILVLVLAVNAGHFTRNTLLYGSPTGPRTDYSNDIFSFNVVASNFIRSTAVHIPLETSISVLDTANEFMMGWLRLLHEFTGLDPIDPRTSRATRTWQSQNMFSAQMSFSEGSSSNPLHAFLIILTTSVGTIWLWNRRQYYALGYMLVLFTAFLLFCGYLTVSPWRHRLHLPVLVLWCPVIAVALFRTDNRLILSVPIIVALFGFNWTFNNRTRPINPDAAFVQENRTDGYFTGRPGLLSVYRMITDSISTSTCTQVGMILGRDTWDYPFWMMLRDQGYHGVIRHIQVNNASKVYERTDFQPCAIITEGSQSGYADFIDHYLGGSGRFHLYMDPETASPPVSVPVGVAVSSDVDAGVFFGSGWYDFETGSNARWMQGNSHLWLYAETATSAVLQLQPHRMHVDGKFGFNGQLMMTLNDTMTDIFSVTTGITQSFPLQLRSGFNRLDLRLAAGDFVPAEVDPSSSDRRHLGISFSPLELTAPQESVRPDGFHLSPDLHVIPGSGWYDFESDAQVRWMQEQGHLWIYAQQETEVLLGLRPREMKVGQAFGSTGQLTVTLNAMVTDVLDITADMTRRLSLQLRPGFNHLTLNLAAGELVPADVMPGNTDTRRLAVAWNPIELTTLQFPALPEGYSVPDGFSLAPDLGVLLGSGWYNFEPERKIRWMQENSDLWVYAEEATSAVLQLRPHVMHVDQAFGTTGQLTVTLNETYTEVITTTTGITQAVPLQLQAGLNQVAFRFGAGHFVPAATVPPLSTDQRQLAIAFAPIVITTSQGIAQPTEFHMPADFRVIPGSGWYDFEPRWNVRWMQKEGDLWIYAPQAMDVRLRLHPYVMHVDQTFGMRGQLRVTVNQILGGEWAMEAGVRSEIPLRLRSGLNQVTLNFLGGDFVPEGDRRSLGIAFYPIEIETITTTNESKLVVPGR